jgi:hypothetical protein
MTQIHTLTIKDAQALLQEWNLSEGAIAILSREPEVVLDLLHSRFLPPLPPGYVPAVVEVLYDDVPYIRSECGVVTFVRHCHPDYQPPFVEYRFDGETAVFFVQGEYVVNRAEGIALTVALQGLLNQEED